MRLQAGRRWRDFWGLEDFVHPYSWHLLELLPKPPDAVITHNLHGGYFDLRALPEIASKVPILSVLHDYWMLTGHCAFPLGCERWKQDCGNCPHLEIPPRIRRDSTRTNIRRKAEIYGKTPLTVSCPSRFVLDDVQKSVLARECSDSILHIPNGVDLELFHPGDQTQARGRLGLPKETSLILMIGNDLERNPFKDYACARGTAKCLAEEGRVATFVVLGGKGTYGAWEVGDIRFHPIPFVIDRNTVADYFRACDVLLHCTRAETAPLVISEALASGLPPIVSDAGNAVELVGDAGFVLPQGDAAAHAAALSRVLDDPELRAELQRRARRQAEASGGVDRMLDSFERWLLDHVPSAACDGPHGGAS